MTNQKIISTMESTLESGNQDNDSLASKKATPASTLLSSPSSSESEDEDDDFLDRLEESAQGGERGADNYDEDVSVDNSNVDDGDVSAASNSSQDENGEEERGGGGGGGGCGSDSSGTDDDGSEGSSVRSRGSGEAHRPSFCLTKKRKNKSKHKATFASNSSKVSFSSSSNFKPGFGRSATSAANGCHGARGGTGGCGGGGRALGLSYSTLAHAHGDRLLNVGLTRAVRRMGVSLLGPS